MSSDNGSSRITDPLFDTARRVRYLSDLPPHQLRRLLAAGTVREFPGESVVVEEGSAVDEVYLILRGSVTVTLYQSLEPACWMYVSGPGALADMFFLLHSSESPVAIRALSSLEVLAIPRDEFAEVMEEEPQVGYAILRDLCTRLSIVNKAALMEKSQKQPRPSLN